MSSITSGMHPKVAHAFERTPENLAITQLTQAPLPGGHFVTKLLEVEPYLINGSSAEDIAEQVAVLFDLSPDDGEGLMFGRSTFTDLIESPNLSIGFREEMIRNAEKFFSNAARSFMTNHMKARMEEAAADRVEKSEEGLDDLINGQAKLVEQVEARGVTGGMVAERKHETLLQGHHDRLERLKESAKWAVSLPDAVAFALQFAPELEDGDEGYSARERYLDNIKYQWGRDYGISASYIDLEDREELEQYAHAKWVPDFEIFEDFPTYYAEAWVSSTEAQDAIRARLTPIEEILFISKQQRAEFFAAFPSASRLAR